MLAPTFFSILVGAHTSTAAPTAPESAAANGDKIFPSAAFKSRLLTNLLFDLKSFAHKIYFHVSQGHAEITHTFICLCLFLYVWILCRLLFLWSFFARQGCLSLLRPKSEANKTWARYVAEKPMLLARLLLSLIIQFYGFFFLEFRFIVCSALWFLAGSDAPFGAGPQTRGV